MDLTQTFDIIIGFIGFLGAWVLKVLWDAVTELKSDLKDLRDDLHDDYVRRDDFNSAISRIEIVCNRIMDKLDEKADK